MTVSSARSTAGSVTASRWGCSALRWPLKLSIQAWSVGVPGRPKWVAMAHSAMNLRVEMEVICEPLSDTASRIGRRSSSVSGSTGWSALASTKSRSPSASRASVKTTSTWVEVSSRGPLPAPGIGTPGARSSRRRAPGRSRRAGRPWWPRRHERGPGHSAPTPFSLDQHQLDRHLLDRLAEAGSIGPCRVELGVALRGLDTRTRRRQGVQGALLGHRADPQDRGAVHLPRLRRLGHRHLLADQLQEDLVLL